MKRFKHAITLATLVAVSVIGLYGCGGDTSTATPVAPTATTAAAAAPTDTAVVQAAPTATTATTSGNGGGNKSGDAMSLLRQSGTAMKGIKSYHIVLQSDMAGSSTTGEGDLQLPDKLRMSIDLGASGKSEIIVIGADTYTKIPGGDSYYHSTGGQKVLGSTANTSALADFAQGATIVGDETLDGVDTTHVKVSYDADKAADQAAQAAGLPNATPSTGLGMVNAEVWIEKSTSYIHKFVSNSTIAGTTSTTTVTFSKYNEHVTPPIEKPANIQEMPGIPTVATP